MTTDTPTQLLINGELRDAQSGRTFATFDPAHGSELAQVAQGGADDVDAAVTAAASTDQLARGRRFCFLFTDLANPTSNRIYRSIGYEAVCDMDMYRFEA